MEMLCFPRRCSVFGGLFSIILNQDNNKLSSSRTVEFCVPFVTVAVSHFTNTAEVGQAEEFMQPTQLQQLPDIISPLEVYKAQWNEITKTFEKLPQEETNQILEQCCYDIPPPFSSITPFPLVNVQLSINNFHFIDHTNRSDLSTQKQLKQYLLNKLANSRNVSINILSPTISEMKDQMELFVKVVRNATKHGCKIRMLLADPDGTVFDTSPWDFSHNRSCGNHLPLASEEKDNARTHINLIIQELHDLIGNQLELYLYDKAFGNSTYQFGTDLVYVSYMMEDTSSRVELLNQKSNEALFSKCENQFKNVLASDKCRKITTS